MLNQIYGLNDSQTRAVNKLTKAGRGIVWWKIGEGKTRIALAWAALCCSDNDSKALVVCSPNAIRQWQDEADICGFSRLKFLSYGELQAQYSHAAVMRALDDTSLRCAIIDELWLYKNVRTIRTKAVHIISSALPTVGLSGSLVTARNIEDLFGQAYAVNIHHSLASNLTKFRTQFCVSAANFGGLKFWAKVDALETIQRRLAPFVDIYFPKAERESKIIPLTVVPTQQQQIHLTDVNSEYFTVLDSGYLEVKNAAVLISKIQQISDGAVLNSEGAISFVESAKLARTVELCHQLSDSGEKVLIWCAFKASIDLLYSKLGKEATTLSSHTEFDFEGWNQGRYKFCIATIGSGASLNDFTNVQYAIIYSAPYNHRAVQQAFGRTNRKGSQHEIAYYYMMQTDQTVDESVYRNLKLTSDVEQSIISTSTQVIQQYMLKFQPTLPGR
jgi:helicase-like protein